MRRFSVQCLKCKEFMKTGIEMQGISFYNKEFQIYFIFVCPSCDNKERMKIGSEFGKRNQRQKIFKTL